MRPTLALMALCACGAPQGARYFSDLDLTVAVDAGDPFIRDDVTLPDRTRRTLEISFRHWHGDIRAMRGWTVIVQDRPVDCGTRGHGGCTDPLTKTMTIEIDGIDCIEAEEIPHEVGHVLHGDPLHLGPGWRQLDAALWNELVLGPAAGSTCHTYFDGKTPDPESWRR